MHWEDSVRLSPLVDTPTDGEASKTTGGQELGIPTIVGGDVRGGLGGGRDLFLPPPEHSRTVHYYQTHY